MIAQCTPTVKKKIIYVDKNQQKIPKGTKSMIKIAKTEIFMPEQQRAAKDKMPPKSKRGRPDVFKRDDAGYAGRIWAPGAGGDYGTKRTAANRYYMTVAVGLISETVSEIPHSELLVDQSKWKIHCQGILVQIGRMLMQDGYGEADVITVAKVAAELRHRRYGSKVIERYIQQGRQTNEW